MNGYSESRKALNKLDEVEWKKKKRYKDGFVSGDLGGLSSFKDANKTTDKIHVMMFAMFYVFYYWIQWEQF